MKGYKAFNADLTCIGYQFTEGQTHVHEGEVELCESGFHFCTEIQDVVNHYCKPTMRVFEVEASGTITDAEDGCSKRACSEIRLVKELSLDEVRDSINREFAAIRWGLNIGSLDRMRQKVSTDTGASNWLIFVRESDRTFFKNKNLNC